jgi:hypothetical protein
MSPRSPPTSATETTDTVSGLAQEKTAVVAPIIDDKDAARLRREKDAATASWIESALQRRLQRGKIESLPSVKPKGCLGGCYLDFRHGSQQASRFTIVTVSRTIIGPIISRQRGLLFGFGRWAENDVQHQHSILISARILKTSSHSIMILGAARARPFSSVAFTWRAMAR